MEASQDFTARNVLLRQMLSAGIAGTLADGITYPMMTVKSRMMVQGSAGAGNSGAVLYMYKGPMHAIQTIASQEGWRTLYKGYATLTQVATAQALYMATYQTTKRIVPGGQDNPVVQFGGGLAATLVQSLINVPVEIIRQRQMVQRAGEGSYKGSLDTVKIVYRQEGFGALYRGFLLAQMVWGPYNAIYLPLWETCKRFAARYSQVDSVEKLDIGYELGSSFFSASVAAAITNPMDVIKTRLQVQGKSNVSNSTNYNGAVDAAKAIWKREGFKGFTCGITSRMFWVAPSSMIMFTTYDQIFKRLNRS
ncbi:mitochondrial substrate carrier family protein E-like [Selaginella moellendorffii]|uniref:mitochondrial substrate carrier family protein E-like n=1 Tax=Selaginella moellendorffii TaxID=88036 RepID=UPI000D1C6A48|nr:mitochondrial substrate carrier family protein E-like [Selaginella moellendorffii]|eukprot:XP_024535125.1 mitochondrial substrate carrier family protein E-like [Selaginella moellendorffii]